MTVAAPLRTTTWPQVAAASRAAATRAASSAAEIAVVRGIATRARAQPRELAGMRRQDGRAAAALPPGVHRGQRAERLGIEQDRRLVRPGDVDQLADQLGGGQPGPQPRSDHDRVVLVVEDAGERRFGVDLLDVVLGEAHRGRLDHLGREERLERLGDRERDQAGSGASGGAADQERRPGIVERAGDDQQLAERALVAARRAGGH